MVSKEVNYEITKPNRKVFSFFCLGSIFLIISLSIGISVGAVPVPTSNVWGIILNKFSPDPDENEKTYIILIDLAIQSILISIFVYYIRKLCHLSWRIIR